MPGEIRGGDTTLLDWPAALHGMPPDASDDESLPSMVPSSSSAVSTTSGAGADLHKSTTSQSRSLLLSQSRSRYGHDTITVDLGPGVSNPGGHYFDAGGATTCARARADSQHCMQNTAVRYYAVCLD